MFVKIPECKSFTAPYALFASIPFIGHMNPLLLQAKELARRGWHVEIVSTSEIANHVEANIHSYQNIKFIDLGTTENYSYLSEIKQRVSEEKLFWKSSLLIMDGLELFWPIFFDGLKLIVKQKRPDVIVADFVTAGALTLAEVEEIKIVVNNPDLLTTISMAYLPPAYKVPMPFTGHSVHHMPWHTLFSYPVLRWLGGQIAQETIGRKLNKFRTSKGLGKININLSWKNYTVLINSAFGLEYQRPLPSNILMIGPMLSESVEPLDIETQKWLEIDLPVVYVNLGTVAMPSPDLIERMYNAFADAPFRVWWILRSQMQKNLPQNRPENIRIDHWGPSPLSVLRHPNVRAFVSHCGINSVHESLAAGTPIVGIPLFADQFDMAMRVQDACVGLFLDKTKFTSSQLRAVIENVLSDSSFLEPISFIQETFCQACGASKAADIIEAVSKK